MKADDEKGISVILIYTALLFFLLGLAARMKMNFHHRMELSTAGFVVAAVLAALAIVLFLFSLRKRSNERLATLSCRVPRLREDISYYFRIS
ncbi:MAG: hypothetical protein DMF35_02155 [Verrucomicrobia bacterium]|nr:MAG: hypothetical protein DMF35_02155 [Verrucomicrobiota bacterium]